MRAHNSEHLDSLPVLDVSALKHVAYVFDALIYYMRSGSSTELSDDPVREGVPTQQWNDQDENENEEEEDMPVTMDTESLDEQEVTNLASMSSSSIHITPGCTSGRGKKHSFFQVINVFVK